MSSLQSIILGTIVIVFIVFSLISVSATISYLNPNEDIYTGSNMGPNGVGSPLYYAVVNDSVLQPTEPDITNYLGYILSEPYTNTTQIFGYQNVSLNVSSVQNVTIWIYQSDQFGLELLPYHVSINPNGTWMAAQTNMITVPASWQSFSFTGNWTKAQINNLQTNITLDTSSDNLQQIFAVYAEINYTADTTPPNITVYSPLNQTYNVSSVVVNFTATDDTGVSSLWYNNGTSNVSYSTPVSLNLSNGNYTFIFYANDTAGNVNSTSVIFEVNVPAPVVTTSTCSASTLIIYNLIMILFALAILSIVLVLGYNSWQSGNLSMGQMLIAFIAVIVGLVVWQVSASSLWSGC